MTDSDDNKRKRDIENKDDDDRNEMFNISKKTLRTPVKTKPREENKLDKLLELVNNLRGDIKELRNEQQEGRRDISELNKKIEKITKENETIKKEHEIIKKENIALQQELKSVNNRLEQLQRESKLNNVIVSGIPIDTNDIHTLKEAMTNFIKENLEIDININTAHKLGQKTCLVKLENYQEKVKIMQNKNKLKHFKAHLVYINNDLTKKEMEIREKLKKRAQEERNKGKTVRIGSQKLTIDGVLWKWSKEDERLKEMGNNGNQHIGPKNI